MQSSIVLSGLVAMGVVTYFMRKDHRRLASKVLVSMLSAFTMSATAFVATSGASGPQAPLYISNTVLTAQAGKTITLTSTGGSGAGAVSYSTKSANCVIKGAVLSVTAAGSCVVTASKAGNATFSPATSAAVTFVFTGINQAALTISSASSSVVGKAIVLATKGGSGTGAVSFTVTGSGCTYTAKSNSLVASAYTTCSVVATKAGSGVYNAANSAAVTITFVPTTFAIINSTFAGTVGTPITVSAIGGSATGTVSYSVTGAGCSIVASTGVLSASAAGSCVVTAKVVSGSKTLATSKAVTFSFTAENPTVAHPDVATLTSVTGAQGAQIDDTVTGRANFINQYFNNNDHWYINYLPAGATVTLTWHVNGSNGLPLANKAVSLQSNLSYSCAQAVTWATASLNSYPGCGASNPQGSLSGTTDANGNVSFTIVNTNILGGSAPADTTTTAGVQANESSTFPWTDMLLQVGSDVYTGDPTKTINQATDRVDFIVIPSSNANATDNPSVAHPDVASLTSVTGTVGSQIDNTVNGDAWFINQYYNNNDHWYGNYINTGATVTLNWHVNGANGQPLPNQPVSLLGNLQYGCAKNLTWQESSLNVYPGCGAGPTGTLSGITDVNGNVSFTLHNTNTDTGSAPADTTTTGGMVSNEGSTFSFTNFVLQVGNDTWTGDPLNTINQGTDRVDFIVIPAKPTSAPTSASYTNPDVATMTAISGTVNSSPLDLTNMGDQWFINAYYSPIDHWNFNYVKVGSTFTETWNVKKFDGTAYANKTVTLETGFANGSGIFTAAGIDANGYVTGTTDASGNVTFTLTVTSTSAAAAPSNTTDPWAALSAEGTNPWSRMALVIGTPVANGGVDPSHGAQGSATDIVTAAQSNLTDVNQATDLVDFIVVA